MKLRVSERGLRVRLDDTEVQALRGGEPVSLALDWPGGGWALTLLPGARGTRAEGSALYVGLAAHMERLLDPLSEGVSVEGFGGTLRVRVEQDYEQTPGS